jgi:MFS family permease
VPLLLLASWAGSAADRFDRKRLLLVTQIASSVLSAGLAALAWAGLARVWVVIACAVLLGIASAFAVPASMAFVGDLVSREQLGSAVALNSMTYNLARATGPALAAVCVSTLGIPASFAINAASYLLLVVALAYVHPAPRRLAKRGEARLRESIRLVREQPRLLGFLLIVAAVGFASDPVNTESPAFAHAFGRPDTDAGYLIGAFGAGAVLAAFVVAGRTAGSRGRMLLTLGLLCGGMVAYSLVPWLSLGYVFLGIAGFGYLASQTAATSRLQLGVEDHQRGRVMALWSVAFLGLRPIASLADGAIAGAFGVRAAGVALAVPAIAAAAAIYLLQRHNAALTSPG